MSEFHRNKHMLGELTMGEYYEMAEFPPVAAIEFKENWGSSYADCHDIAMNAEMVVFRLGGARHDDFVLVPRSSKVRVDENKVRTKDEQGRDMTIRFYDLKPTPDPLRTRT